MPWCECEEGSPTRNHYNCIFNVTDFDFTTLSAKSEYDNKKHSRKQGNVGVKTSANCLATTRIKCLVLNHEYCSRIVAHENIDIMSEKSRQT